MCSQLRKGKWEEKGEGLHFLLRAGRSLVLHSSPLGRKWKRKWEAGLLCMGQEVKELRKPPSLSGRPCRTDWLLWISCRQQSGPSGERVHLMNGHCDAEKKQKSGSVLQEICVFSQFQINFQTKHHLPDCNVGKALFSLFPFQSSQVAMPSSLRFLPLSLKNQRVGRQCNLLSSFVFTRKNSNSGRNKLQIYSDQFMRKARLNTENSDCLRNQL